MPRQWGPQWGPVQRKTSVNSELYTYLKFSCQKGFFFLNKKSSALREDRKILCKNPYLCDSAVVFRQNRVLKAEYQGLGVPFCNSCPVKQKLLLIT